MFFCNFFVLQFLPFLSYFQIRHVHPHLVRSLVAHLLLSTTSSSNNNNNNNNLLNLNFQQLPCDPVACWRLRCLLCYLHSLLQPKTSLNLLNFSKEVLSQEGENKVSSWKNSDLPLIPLTVVEDEDEAASGEHLRLLCLPNLSDISPVQNAAVLRYPETLVPLIIAGDSLGPKESLRVSNFSFISTLRLSNSADPLNEPLGNLLAGLQPASAHNVVAKSELRRPSVDAVTSAATSSSSAPPTLSSEQFSLSDSCAENNNNNSDSELSYNVSEGGAALLERKQGVTKKKNTFSERLKAALARGNTPDESDDASVAGAVPLAVRRVRAPVNQRPVRRQVENSVQFSSSSLFS